MPVATSMEPEFAVVVVPVRIFNAPDVVPVDWPDFISTSPDSPLSEVPERMYIYPLALEVDDPDITLIVPPFPVLLLPVLNNIPAPALPI